MRTRKAVPDYLLDDIRLHLKLEDWDWVALDVAAKMLLGEVDRLRAELASQIQEHWDRPAEGSERP